MKKVLIKIYVPALAEAFEMFFPLQLKLYEMIPLIGRAVEEYSEGQYRSSGKEVLCTRQEGKVLDINYSAEEQGIRNGSTLILI